jgi:hypothetical protein
MPKSKSTTKRLRKKEETQLVLPSNQIEEDEEEHPLAQLGLEVATASLQTALTTVAEGLKYIRVDGKPRKR